MAGPNSKHTTISQIQMECSLFFNFQYDNSFFVPQLPHQTCFFSSDFSDFGFILCGAGGRGRGLVGGRLTNLPPSPRSVCVFFFLTALPGTDAFCVLGLTVPLTILRNSCSFQFGTPCGIRASHWSPQKKSTVDGQSLRLRREPTPRPLQ